MFRKKKHSIVMAPRDSKGGLPSLSPSKLPRSRTMNVLSSIKSTFSRPNLQEDAIEEDQLKVPSTLIQSSFSRPDLRKDAMCAVGSSPFQEIASDSSPASRSRESVNSLSSCDSLKSKRRQKRSPSPLVDLEFDDDPSHVHVRMDPEYWGGRFVGLHDHFRNETHQEQLDVISALTADMYPTLFHDGGSAVNSASEQYLRAKRVFVQLDLLCMTEEARASLHAWQQDYARKVNNCDLLPKDGTMSDRSLFKRKPGLKATSSRNFTAPPVALRKTSFGINAKSIKLKKSSLGSCELVQYQDDEEEIPLIPKPPKAFVPTRKVSTSTRIPTPTFVVSKRSDRTTTSQATSPTNEEPVKHKGSFGFGRKTSIGYVTKTPVSRDAESKRRGTSFGMTREPSPPSLPPSLPTTFHGLRRDTSIPNLSKGTRRQTQNPNESRIHGIGREKSTSEINQKIEPHNIRPGGLPRDKTIPNLRSNDIKTRPSLPRDKTIPNLSQAASTNEPKNSPRKSFPTRPMTRYTSLQTIPSAPESQIPISPSKRFPKSTTNTNLTGRSSNVYNNLEFQPRKSSLAPPIITRDTDGIPVQNPSLPPPVITREGNSHSFKVARYFTPKGKSRRPPPRVSDESVDEVFVAEENDEDLWPLPPLNLPPLSLGGSPSPPPNLGVPSSPPRNQPPLNLKFSPMRRESGGVGASNYTDITAGGGRGDKGDKSGESKDMGVAAEEDDIGEPLWDNRGYPYYFFDGKRFYVPSRPVGDLSVEGGVGVAGGKTQRVITEDREDTTRRLVGKRDGRRERERRMLEEGREIERMGVWVSE